MIAVLWVAGVMKEKVKLGMDFRGKKENSLKQSNNGNSIKHV